MAQTLGIAIGALAVLAGAYVFAAMRRDAEGLLRPTALAIGLSLMLLGYHALAWSLPERWLPLRIPAARWPLLAAGAIIAVLASVWVDRFERTR
ncbi:MAG: hypothetical protein ACF8R7_03490 [Phycisphaerales bacterium JB039]